MTHDFEKIIGNSDLLAKIVHELRTPIHGILGVSSFLYENWETINNDVKKSSIDELYKSGNFLEELVNKLLRSLQVSSDTIIYNPETINIVEVAEKTIRSSNISLINKDSVNISLNCRANNTHISVDSFWIGQVLSNLIVNAIKHSSCRNIKIQIDSKGKLINKELMISVVDDGIGIPIKDIQIIFDSFKQGSATSSPLEGFGLGLSMCREIIEAHGGKIWAENNGTTTGASLIFTLPVGGLMI